MKRENSGKNFRVSGSVTPTKRKDSGRNFQFEKRSVMIIVY